DSCGGGILPLGDFRRDWLSLRPRGCVFGDGDGDCSAAQQRGAVGQTCHHEHPDLRFHVTSFAWFLSSVPSESPRPRATPRNWQPSTRPTPHSSSAADAALNAAKK